MKYTVLRRKIPADPNPVHVCNTPTWLGRWVRRLRYGAIVRCECGKRYMLRWYGAGDGGVWVWDEIGP